MPQEPEPHTLTAPGDYRLDSWMTDKGLPQNTVQCLAQTDDGYLWVGTPSGLARYDGRSFTTFDRNNTPALKSDNILCLAAGPDNTLWIGTQDGLVGLQGHTFTHFDPGVLHPTIKSLPLVIAERDGTVLWATGGFVGSLRNGAFSVLTNFQREVTCLLRDDAGALWVGTGSHLVYRAPGSTDWSVVHAGIASGLFKDGEGDVWSGTEQGARQYRNGLLHDYGPAEGLMSGRASSFTEDPRKDLWMLAGGRLYRCRMGQVSRVHIKFPPGWDDNGTCVLGDREGNIWLGTERSGLVRLSVGRFVTYTTQDGLVTDSIWSISEGTDGSVWIAGGGGVSRLLAEKFTNFSNSAPRAPFSGPGWRGRRTVLASRKGQIWTGRPLSVLTETRSQVVRPECQAFLGGVDTLYEDHAGAIWAAGDLGLWRFREGAAEFYTTVFWTNGLGRTDLGVDLQNCVVHTNALNCRFLSGILEDCQGNLWLGSVDSGLHCLRDGRFSTLTVSNGLTSNYVGPLLAEPDGTLWVGSDKGLNRLKNGQIARLTTADGLVENIVGNLLEDDQGWFWTMGHRGLHRMRKSELVEVAEGKRDRVAPLSYGAADGMLSIEANVGLFPNACRTSDGLLWFPTTRGVLVVEPNFTGLWDVPPPVVLEQVVAVGQDTTRDRIIFGSYESVVGPASSVSYGGTGANTQTALRGRAIGAENRLAAGSARWLEFHYTANVFAASERVRFKVMLEGRDRDWRDVGSRRTAVYTDLAPGSYRFLVLALNSHGVKSEAPAEFAFSLAPHFYQTRVFHAGSALCVLLSGLGLHRVHVGRLVKRKSLEQQLALAHQRERIAKDMHDDLGASLTQITLLGEHARHLPAGSPEVLNSLERIVRTTRATTVAAEEMVWVVSPRHDSLDSLTTYLCRLAHEYLEPTGICCRLDLPTDLPAVQVSSEMRHHLVLFLKEGLNNVVKHSGAQEVWLAIKVVDSELTLALLDDGSGCPNFPKDVPTAKNPRNGNGLGNLRKRAESIGGRFEFSSGPGRGTLVKLVVKLAR